MWYFFLYFLDFIFEFFYFCHFIYCQFIFFSNSNFSFDVCSCERILLLVLTGVLVFKFEGRPGICTLDLLIPRYCIFWHIWDNVSFKFGGVKNTFFFCLLCLFLSLKKKKKNCYVVVKRELYCNYGLHFMGLFNILNTSCQ